MSSRASPLVYTCSGCLSAAQVANRPAIDLDRAGRAEMSCTSGAGGGVRAPVKTVRSGRPVLALDGCAPACVRACLATVGMAPDVYLVLNQRGAKKCYHADCSDDELSAAAALVDNATNTPKHRPDAIGD